jgi:hypothetical protein
MHVLTGIGAGGDHVQDVYGWTREAVMYAARVGHQSLA